MLAPSWKKIEAGIVSEFNGDDTFMLLPWELKAFIDVSSISDCHLAARISFTV